MTTTPPAHRRIQYPRHLRAGTAPITAPGTELTCLVLSPGPEEWVGVDLASGALLRSRPEGGRDLQRARTPDGAARLSARFDIVALTLADNDEPLDPARPEAIVALGPPTLLGRARRRPARRLLDQLASPERAGASLLSTWGTSIAFRDLDGTSQSVVVIETSPRALGLGVRTDGEVVATVSWSGITQTVLVSDPIARRAAFATEHPLKRGELVESLGFRPSYLICGLAAVRQGHAKKLVLAVLPRRVPRRWVRRMRRLLRERTGGEVLRHRPAEGDEGVPA
ncbi:MAG: hypothetical protein ABSA31_07620 [Acidimicrobiales bacterium]